MKAVLIPVKVFAESKKRLAPSYSVAARAELAQALCQDFFAVVARARGFDCVFAVSQEPQALAWAEEHGWNTIVENAQISESHSVDAASRFCEAAGVHMLLRLPIDIPLATPEDIESVLAAAEESPCAVIVPSRDGTGTNALLRSPPTLFPSHFGPDSFELHRREAERSGARIRTIRNPRLELDIDEATDLDAAEDGIPENSATSRWFARYRGLPGG